MEVIRVLFLSLPHASVLPFLFCQEPFLISTLLPLSLPFDLTSTPIFHPDLHLQRRSWCLMAEEDDHTENLDNGWDFVVEVKWETQTKYS
ncbi:hypothetical protein L1987_01512 [Smallanthus sonchifolius]|uniref:Uncharacterized protein n=1 Tax=Smallanthus sonchifolius TaxID=185202 RepID=A0ACB9K594_9ASTR|nr:hypothetical protein L1987_01512 [Smallanthus sonchifolius]